MASELAVTDTVNKCGKPISWWPMNAHEEKQRLILSAFSTLLSLCKMFGWMTLGSVVNLVVILPKE
uniref:Uncharacterized protein n=1 Tax=Panthera tigris altaica TaxID=74533 RepID=A0A8C9L027_PANTA